MESQEDRAAAPQGQLFPYGVPANEIAIPDVPTVPLSVAGDLENLMTAMENLVSQGDQPQVQHDITNNLLARVLTLAKSNGTTVNLVANDFIRKLIRDADKVSVKQTPSSQLVKSVIKMTAVDIMERNIINSHVNLSSDVSPERVRAILPSTIKELRNARFEIRRNGQAMPGQRLADKDIEIWLDVIFMGAMKHGPISLWGLISHLSTLSANDDDPGIAQRALTLSNTTTIPSTLRQLFFVFSQTEQDRTVSVLSTEEKVTAFILRCHRSLELWAKYSYLTNETTGGQNRGVRIFLNNQGYDVGVGRDWRSVVVSYLSTELQVTKTVLENRCRRGLPLKILTDAFTTGIIPLLPTNSLTQLSKQGRAKTEAAVPILASALPGLADICELVKEHVYDKIISGEPILIRKPAWDSRQHPFKEALESVIEEAPNDMQVDE